MLGAAAEHRGAALRSATGMRAATTAGEGAGRTDSAVRAVHGETKGRACGGGECGSDAQARSTAPVDIGERTSTDSNSAVHAQTTLPEARVRARAAAGKGTGAVIGAPILPWRPVVLAATTSLPPERGQAKVASTVSTLRISSTGCGVRRTRTGYSSVTTWR